MCARNTKKAWHSVEWNSSVNIFPFPFSSQFVKRQSIWLLYWTLQAVSEALTLTK